MQRADKMVDIWEETLPKLQLDDALPFPAEQADQLILWVGNHQRSPAEFASIPELEMCAWLGMKIKPERATEGLSWLTDQAELAPLIEKHPVNARRGLRLTMAGWGRFSDLQRSAIRSRTALMAMKFGDEELDKIVETCFKPAAEKAGFQLRLITDGQPAGLIDDQLRVALRTSRFVVADLTHGNNGAYWEAGFAEGLGRPVIYTCREREWNESDSHGKKKVHFDTNHLVTIVWDATKPDEIVRRLTATIRSTLPDEAIMAD